MSVCFEMNLTKTTAITREIKINLENIGGINMNIKVNGEAKNIKDGVNVTEMLKIEDVEMPDMVSVQLNGEFVDRDQFVKTVLKENDEIEVLYFMGGGSLGI
ncbi:sulfur carrier protein ThiS [Clostridium estertheticum]|uniref:sulfur carrier protein ThiS n=1 Tax=Clostridium estertheticum TaxID=238834 RepID=UPI0035CD22A1